MECKIIKPSHFTFTVTHPLIKCRKTKFEQVKAKGPHNTIDPYILKDARLSLSPSQLYPYGAAPELQQDQEAHLDPRVWHDFIYGHDL
jgi:hypothetical protein